MLSVGLLSILMVESSCITFRNLGTQEQNNIIEEALETILRAGDI